MKALVLEEYNKLVYRDWPDPEIAPTEVLIQVKACGICGSDIHGMDGSTGRRIPPIIMGHEASGTIVNMGSSVKNWKIGDRVTFDSTIYPLDDWYTKKGLYNLSDNRKVLGVSTAEYRRHGALAEYVAVPEHILYRIPDEVSFNQAALVEPAAVAAHAVSLTPISLNDTAIVFGVGMIGLFIVQVLQVSGCGKIIAVDVNQQNLALSKKLGADEAFLSEKDLPKKIKALTGGRGADIAFEVVGITSTILDAVAAVRKGATITLVGNLSAKVELPLQAVVTQQIRLQGSCAIAGEYPAILSMIESGKINVDAVLSAVAPLSQGADWFKRLYNKEKELKKIVLNP